MGYLLISVCGFVAQNFGNKEFGYRFGKYKNATFIQNETNILTMTILVMILCRFTFAKGVTLLLSAVYAVFNVLTSILLVKAMSFGSLVESAVLCNVGVFFSSLYGVFRYGDEVTVATAIAAVLMLVVVLLSIPKKQDRSKSTNGMRWFLYAGLSGVTNGINACVKRTAAVSEMPTVLSFVFSAYVFAAILFLVVMYGTGLLRDKEALHGVFSRPKEFLLCGIVAGVGSTIATVFQLRALQTISSVIVYPLNAGLLIAVLSLFSFLRYRDTELSVRSILSIVLCVAGVVLYSI